MPTLRWVLIACLTPAAAALLGAAPLRAEIVSLRPADMELMRGIEDQCFIGREMLGGLKENDPPEKIVARLDALFLQVQGGGKKLDPDWYETYAPLGALWGEQIGRSYGWQWYRVWLAEDEGGFRYALVAPDRSALIYPFEHLMACAAGGTPVSIALIHRAIGASEWVAGLPADSLTDILASPALLLMTE